MVVADTDIINKDPDVKTLYFLFDFVVNFFAVRKIDINEFYFNTILFSWKAQFC